MTLFALLSNAASLAVLAGWRGAMMRAGVVADVAFLADLALLALLAGAALLATLAVIAGFAFVLHYILPVAADFAVIGVAVANFVSQIFPIFLDVLRLLPEFVAQLFGLRAVLAVLLDRLPQLLAVLVHLPLFLPDFPGVLANLAIVGVAVADIVPQFLPILRDVARWRRRQGDRRRRVLCPRPGGQQARQRNAQRLSANHS